MASSTSSPPPQPLTAGTVVAQRYEVLRELGRGGMGVVYLCYDRVSGEEVGVKCVFFDPSSSRERDVVWFQQEVRALAALDHPTIVHARDFGVLPDGSPYLVMDALRGRSIHVWKYLCRLPWPAVWTVVDQALAGLAHAHARGIIHGDLKPSNILIDPRGGVEEPQAYILDLGLAWLLADHIDPRLDLKRPGAPTMPFGLGTPGWMAPEQIRNAAPHIGPPTDLYALGSILFELLTRRELYEGSTAELLRQHRDDPIPPVDLPDDVPPAVSLFVTKLLAKRPWHRFRYAADARAAWATFQPSGPIRWNAPRVRVGDEKHDPSLLATSPPTQGGNARRLAPGILSLRPSPLVGRAIEREGLWNHTTAIARGEAPPKRFCTLRGEAGVGKSKLAEWLCETAHETGTMIPLRMHYRRVPGPLEGMRGAVLSHYNLVGQPRDVIEQALINEWEIEKEDENGRTWVAAAATWLCPEVPDDALVGPSGKRFVLDKPSLRFAVSRHILERIAGLSRRPLLLWLDDLHLAPSTTFDSLTELAQESPSLRLMLVTTVRDEALAANRAATARLTALVRRYPSFELSLSRLDEPETRRLLRATLPLAPEAEAAVVTRSRGNPLYALQLVHAWASGGYLKLVGNTYAVPAPALRGRATTTAELWNERLGTVDDALRPAAHGAAALGEVFRVDVFGYLLGALGLEVRTSLDSLRRAEILLLERGQRLRWPHALLREHVFAQLLESPDAARIFRAAADALAVHPESDSRRIVRQRISNLLQAGDADAAADVLFVHVERVWSHARDVNTLRSDLALIETTVTGARAAHFKRWKAETERHAGHLAEARTLAEEARRTFNKLGDELHEAHCLRLLAHITSDQGAPALGRIEGVLARATYEALNHNLGRAACDVVLGEIDYLLGDHARARTYLVEGAEIFRREGDLLGLAQCLILQSLSEQSAGRLVPARELLIQARITFDQIGYQLGLAQADIALAHVEHRDGSLDAAYELAVKTRARFRTLDNPRGEAACERLAAMAAFDRNDFDNARTHATTALTIYDQRLADPWGRVEGLVLLAQHSLALFDRKEAERLLTQALAITIDEAEPLQHRYLTTAWYQLILGQANEAVASIAAARATFPDPSRTGDHTLVLLPRLIASAKGTAGEAPLRQWLEFLQPSSLGPSSATHQVASSGQRTKDWKLGGVGSVLYFFSHRRDRSQPSSFGRARPIIDQNRASG